MSEFWGEVALTYCRSLPGLETAVLMAPSHLAAAQLLKDRLEPGWWQRYYMDSSGQHLLVKTASQGGRTLGRASFMGLAEQMRASAEQLRLF